jgi:hypothetical protein
MSYTNGHDETLADVLDLTGDERPRGVEIELTIGEARYAYLVGVLRNIVNVMVGRRPAYGLDPERPGWHEHVLGAPGELVTAKWRCIPWSGTIGMLDAQAGDVDGLGVRTRAQDWHELLIQRDDADDRRFVLVVPVGAYVPGISRRWRIVGWMDGAEAKRVGRWEALTPGRPCFVVPQAALHSLATLAALLNARGA